MYLGQSLLHQVYVTFNLFYYFTVVKQLHLEKLFPEDMSLLWFKKKMGIYKIHDFLT